MVSHGLQNCIKLFVFLSPLVITLSLSPTPSRCEKKLFFHNIENCALVINGITCRQMLSTTFRSVILCLVNIDFVELFFFSSDNGKNSLAFYRHRCNHFALACKSKIIYSIFLFVLPLVRLSNSADYVDLMLSCITFFLNVCLLWPILSFVFCLRRITNWLSNDDAASGTSIHLNKLPYTFASSKLSSTTKLTIQHDYVIWIYPHFKFQTSLFICSSTLT